MLTLENFKTLIINDFEINTNQTINSEYQTKDNYYGHLIEYTINKYNLDEMLLRTECRNKYMLDYIVISDTYYWPELFINFIIKKLFSKL